MDVRVGPWRRLSAKGLMVLNCGFGEDSESPLDCKEIQPVHTKGDQSWIFIGRTDAEAETPILWPPDGKNWLIGKDPDAGKDWRQEEKGTTEDEMVGWHHRLNGHGFWWTLGVGDGQGVVHGATKSQTWLRTELNWTEPKAIYRFNAISIQLTIAFFTEVEQKISVFIWEYKRLQITETIFRKNGAGGLNLTDLGLYSKAAVIKAVWYWHKNRNTDQCNKTGSPEKNACTHGQLIFDKGGKNT